MTAALYEPPSRKNRSGTEKRRRHSTIGVRVYDDERAKIAANAAAAELCPSSFLRTLGTGDRRSNEHRRLTPEMKVTAQFLAQLGRLGGNVYQLVRGMNLGDLPECDELAEAARELRAFIAAAREAFGLQRGLQC
jgi:hypothetical protein